MLPKALCKQGLHSTSLVFNFLGHTDGFFLGWRNCDMAVLDQGSAQGHDSRSRHEKSAKGKHHYRGSQNPLATSAKTH